jgi:hypothetical protein
LQQGSDLFRDMCRLLAATIDPVSYLETLGFVCCPWQREVLGYHKRLILKCPRQSGKSTVIAAKKRHKCKHNANLLVMLFAPTENQAMELICTFPYRPCDELNTYKKFYIEGSRTYLHNTMCDKKNLSIVIKEFDKRIDVRHIIEEVNQ